MIGALATVALVDDEHDVLWVRYASGNAGFLSPDSGPAVAVGSTILVMEDFSFFDAPSELFPSVQDSGSLATVVLDVEREPLWVRYASGGFGPLNRDSGPEVSVGSVVLVSGNTFIEAPGGLLPPHQNGVGVVRRVEETRSLIETEHSIVWLPHAGVIDWKEWSTVEIVPAGVLKELDEQPVRYRDDPPAATMIHSRFRVEPGDVTETFDDIAGLDDQITELRQIIDQLKNAEELKRDGILPVRGILLAGESGTGKTMLARAMSNEAEAVFFQVRGPEIASKWINESEETLRALLDEAESCDRAIVFFDEIDSVATARSNTSHEMSNKLITQFLTVMDGFKARRTLVVGATNRPDALDPTLLRTGRFDRRIDFPLPDLDAREAILKATKPTSAAVDIDFFELASLTDQWCSADLRGMWSEARTVCPRRRSHESPRVGLPRRSPAPS